MFGLGARGIYSTLIKEWELFNWLNPNNTNSFEEKQDVRSCF